MAVVFFLRLIELPASTTQVPTSELANAIGQAHAAVVAQQWEAAAASYEKAIQLAPRSAKMRVEYGEVLTKLRRLPEAIESYREALRILPQNMPAQIGLAEAYRAVPNFEEAKHILETCSREHSKSARPLATMGDIEIQLQTYDAAIIHLRTAVQLEPANVANRNLLAAAYKAKGDARNALTELQKTLALDPKNALALYLRAEIYADQAEVDRALADAHRVVALEPKNRRANVLLAKILLRTMPGESETDVTKRCNQAVAALQGVRETEIKDSETLFLMARAYRCAGQTEEADRTVEAFEAASQNERSVKENEAQARHLVQEANDAALKNDRVRALGLAEQALAKNPDDGAVYSLLAKIYYSSGKVDEAEEAIMKALGRDPFHPDFLYVQGKILQRQGKTDEALAAFIRTTLVNPKESDAYFEIGTIYQQRHDANRAIAAYKKALELSPDDPDYRRALANLSTEPTPEP